MDTFNYPVERSPVRNGVGAPDGPASRRDNNRDWVEIPAGFACSACGSYAVVEDLWLSDASIWLECVICGDITTIAGAPVAENSAATELFPLLVPSRGA